MRCCQDTAGALLRPQASLPSCKQLLYGCLTSDDLYEFCGDSQAMHMHDIFETRGQELRDPPCCGSYGDGACGNCIYSWRSSESVRTYLAMTTH